MRVYNEIENRKTPLALHFHSSAGPISRTGGGSCYAFFSDRIFTELESQGFWVFDRAGVVFWAGGKRGQGATS